MNSQEEEKVNSIKDNQQQLIDKVTGDINLKLTYSENKDDKLTDSGKSSPVCENNDDDDEEDSDQFHTDDEESQDEDDDDDYIKCSAISTMERDMPTEDISGIVEKLRNQFLTEAKLESNLGKYNEKDLKMLAEDEWQVRRYLLRNHLDYEKSLEMMRISFRFKNESCIDKFKTDTPDMFYQLGGIFPYETDRKGNVCLYMRGKCCKRCPEITTFYHYFVYYNLLLADEAAKGRGIAMIFDLTGAGVSNCDMEALYFLATVLKNYFPKGLSYILVHELPFYLRPFWLIAKAWLPNEQKQLIKFSSATTIREYIDDANLPDFMGGSCARSYNKPPNSCLTIAQAIKIWGVKPSIALKILDRFAALLDSEQVEKTRKELTELLDKENKTN